MGVSFTATSNCTQTEVVGETYTSCQHCEWEGIRGARGEDQGGKGSKKGGRIVSRAVASCMSRWSCMLDCAREWPGCGKRTYDRVNWNVNLLSFASRTMGDEA